MKATKVIKCKIVGLTKGKRESIEKEYQAVQDLLQLEKKGIDFLPLYVDLPIHSIIKQQSIRFFKKNKFEKEYPISLRKDAFKIEKRDNKIAKYWMRIPCFDYCKTKQKLWVAIKPHMDIPDDVTLCESKLFKKGDDFFVHICIQKEVPEIHTHNIIGIDLGSRWVATACDISNGHTRFYGKDVRETRGKYFYLRRTANKDFGEKENRIVNDQLHKLTRNIVDWAKQTNSTIVIGDLKGVKGKSKKGRRFNRKVNSMPSFKVKQMIQYKSAWAGIPVQFVNEAWTSQTCSKCGERGTRTNGLFKCSCGYEDNSDRNGAINIAKRGSGYISESGAVNDQLEHLRLNEHELK